MNTVPVCFTIDERYDVPCDVVITSLMENKKDSTFYDFFIIHSGLSEEDKNIIHSIQDDHADCKINLIFMHDKLPNEKIKSDSENRNEAIFFRLFIPEIPELQKYDKVIYSDVDMVYLEDISDIYAANLNNKYLAATKDGNVIYNKEYFDGNTFSSDYFISNLLVMNLRLMRKDKITEKAINFFYKNHERIKFHDQDILNELCHGETAKEIMVEYLPPRSSVFYPLFRDKEDSVFYTKFSSVYSDKELEAAMNTPVSLHFVGEAKPWNTTNPNDLWMEYFNKTGYHHEKK